MAANDSDCARMGTVPPEGYYFVDTKNDLFYYKDDKLHIYKCFDNRTKDFYVCERPYDGLFDSANWVKLFEFTAAAGGAKDLQYLRVSLILDTYSRLEKGWYTGPSGARVTFAPDTIKVKANLSRVKEYDFSQCGFPALPAENRPHSATEVSVVSEDAVSVAVDAAQTGAARPALVNMANAYGERGGYLERAGAQEENLFRRSNCNQFLDPQKSPAAKGAKAGCCWPGVSVFRGRESEGYPLLPAVARLDVLVVPVFRKEETEEMVMEKIKTVFEMARDNGNDVVVVNATGCGESSVDITKLFLDATKFYQGCFKKIVFATVGK